MTPQAMQKQSMADAEVVHPGTSIAATAMIWCGGGDVRGRWTVRDGPAGG
jgi:hypothetical protein